VAVAAAVSAVVVAVPAVAATAAPAAAATVAALRSVGRHAEGRCAHEHLEGSERPATSKTSSSRGACATAPTRPAATPAAIARASIMLLSIVCGFRFRLAFRFQHVEPALLLQHLLVQRVVHDCVEV
jgi:hypothetical protein